MHVDLKMGKAISIHLANLHPNTGANPGEFPAQAGLFEMSL
jgi:hypothetical protein